MTTSDREYIAHVNKEKHIQTVDEHLNGVALLAKENMAKFGLESLGELLGLLHDVGKYSREFQDYIASETGLLDQDADEGVDTKSKKGKVDHSTSGAQWVFGQLEKIGYSVTIGQMVTLCLVSHHSGLIDCLAPDGTNVFLKRMNKPRDLTHIDEIMPKISNEIKSRVNKVVNDNAFMNLMIEKLNIFFEVEKQTVLSTNANESNAWALKRAHFKLGLFLRVFFSALIDADRTDTADFENQKTAKFRQKGNYVSWDILCERLESHLNNFKKDSNVDRTRRKISEDCFDSSARPLGIYTLTVPTGGGKTLASLRFALQHAKHHTVPNDPTQSINHIFYVIPFTSIIDQNADVARSVLEIDADSAGKIVLEHHSNIAEGKDTWQNKTLSENWDAPIVFTTMVQFLESFFSRGTKSVRRLHQLANSIIIFDEVQRIPINCVHLFCNALNFLAQHCNSTIVLCTATQPLLDRVDFQKGAIQLADNHELVSHVENLFKDLKRVEVTDECKDGGWSDEEIARRAIIECDNNGSCLVIVNTTNSASSIFQKIKDKFKSGDVMHLSARMCPKHRREVVTAIKKRLNSNTRQPVICVSTQVIEAGVDIDFGSVIRLLAGIDSIAQAAGRCNRNGLRECAQVLIVNSNEEKTEKLLDIYEGQRNAQRILGEFKQYREMYGGDLLSPKTMEMYFNYYFFERKDEMIYPVTSKKDGVERNDNLLNMLSINNFAVSEHRDMLKKPPEIFMRQSFKTAAEIFNAIDAPTRGVIVPYGEEGRVMIANLCGADVKVLPALLRKAQQYSVNIYPNLLKALQKIGAIYEAQEGSDILCLKKEYYSDDFGLSEGQVSMIETLIC